MVAVELERDMLALLTKTTQRYANVELLARNLLFLNPVDVFGNAPYKLVANLPYYITAPTFRHFLESKSAAVYCGDGAARGSAAHCSCLRRSELAGGQHTVLWSSTDHCAGTRKCVYPAPKVDSAILRIDVNSHVPSLSRSVTVFSAWCGRLLRKAQTSTQLTLTRQPSQRQGCTRMAGNRQH